MFLNHNPKMKSDKHINMHVTTKPLGQLWHSEKAFGYARHKIIFFNMNT